MVICLIAIEAMAITAITNPYYKSTFFNGLVSCPVHLPMKSHEKTMVMKSRGGETPAKLGRHGQVAGDWRKRLGCFRVPKKTLKSRILRKLIKC